MLNISWCCISCVLSSVYESAGSDHGVKAQGDGWLLTVALIEGSNLAAVDSTGYSDPYVIFSCNGKTKTSSIKFQMLNPQWNGNYSFNFGQCSSNTSWFSALLSQH